MSSLAASRADGYYFPPNYDGRGKILLILSSHLILTAHSLLVHGGISKFNNPNYNGSNQWEKSGVVRFELPFDGWCLGCKRHISKGSRFNAKKDNAGKYFSTTIFSFSMKCATCPQGELDQTSKDSCHIHV